MTTPAAAQQRRERDAIARIIARAVVDGADLTEYGDLAARFDELDQEVSPRRPVHLDDNQPEQQTSEDNE
jgi:hypothetical protein